MYNPENAFIRKTTNPEMPLSPKEQAVYDWYVLDESSRKQRVASKQLTDMDEFAGTIDSDSIKNDKLKIIKKRNSEKEKYKTQRGELFEKVFEVEALRNEWFGKDCSITHTLEYDDRFNGIDVVLEWKDESGKITRLGIDCTTSENPEKLTDKASSIIERIDLKESSKVKYYKSPQGELGVVQIIPRVVLPIRKETLEFLCDDLVFRSKNKLSEKIKQHYLQMTFLLEAERQLESQKDYIEILIKRNGQERMYLEMIKSLDVAIKILETLIEQKESSLGSDATERAIDELDKSPMLEIFRQKARL